MKQLKEYLLKRILIRLMRYIFFILGNLQEILNDKKEIKYKSNDQIHKFQSIVIYFNDLIILRSKARSQLPIYLLKTLILIPCKRL